MTDNTLGKQSVFDLITEKDIKWCMKAFNAPPRRLANGRCDDKFGFQIVPKTVENAQLDD